MSCKLLELICLSDRQHSSMEYQLEPFGTSYGKKNPIGSKPGKVSVLTDQEELKIVGWVSSLARAGFPVSLKPLRISVGQFVKLTKKATSFNNGIPGKRWKELLLKRHTGISSNNHKLMRGLKKCVLIWGRKILNNFWVVQKELSISTKYPVNLWLRSGSVWR